MGEAERIASLPGLIVLSEEMHPAPPKRYWLEPGYTFELTKPVEGKVRLPDRILRVRYNVGTRLISLQTELSFFCSDRIFIEKMSSGFVVFKCSDDMALAGGSYFDWTCWSADVRKRMREVSHD